MTQNKDAPSLEELIRLEILNTVKIAPGGRRIAYSVRSTNWRENRYEHDVFIHDAGTGKAARLTRQGRAGQFEWACDDDLLVLVRGEDGKGQVYLFEGLVGEGRQVTDHKTGVERFWPFGEGLLYLGAEPGRQEKKDRSERFGDFKHFEREDSPSALYYVDLAALAAFERDTRQRAEKESGDLVRPVIEISKLLETPLKIEGVVPARDGRSLYLNCRKGDELVYLNETSAWRIDINPEDMLLEHIRLEQKKKQGSEGDESEVKDQKLEDDFGYLGKITRIPLPRTARVAALSPDSTQLLVSYTGPESKMYDPSRIWLLPAEALGSETEITDAMQDLTGSLDRSVPAAKWTDAGIFTRFIDGTEMRFARLYEDGPPEPLDLGEVVPFFFFEQFDVSETGRIAFGGAGPDRFTELYYGDFNEDFSLSLTQVTDLGAQLGDWQLGSREVVRWPSRDGVEVEGVLYKPADYDPEKKYPLVFVVHGGPRWYSGRYLLSSEDLGYYPSIQFLQKDVLVLKPNYRGSEGRGEDFMRLNVDNLGVGDLWDLESAIDYLDGLGMIDTEKVGSMGWSQGGYISAFVGLHSERFAAVSVGAGISDWYTYHVSNDIPQFTTDYLSASPFRDREVYRKTSPIENLDNASTPVLIQHGTEDQRVPVSNAYELFRGLQEVGVPVELFLYPGMAHPITKPRQNHAVMWQNLNWFGHYLLGEELDLLGEGDGEKS